MDIFPIWKSTFYETETDRVKFRIMKWGTDEICRATAVRLPDDELLRIGLNKPCQNYLDSNIDVSATGTTSSNAYAEFSLQIWNESNSQWFNAYEFAFVNDWSYSEHEDTGSFSEPINGHAAPGQLIPYTICSTSTTQETICYDEYDFNAYLVVNPATITFDQTGGTATITIFANANWTITQYGNLVSLSQTTGTSGTTTISVHCPENLTIREFTDTLRVSAYKRGTIATEYVHITQEAATPYVRITSGGNEYFNLSGGTWVITYDTNIPVLYYEMTDRTNVITGYTSNGRLSFDFGSVSEDTYYDVDFYDAPGGTLYATAYATQTSLYFKFITPDYGVVLANETNYEVLWETTYSSITYVFNSTTATTTESGVTTTFPQNLNLGTTVIYSLTAYNDGGYELGTIHWLQCSAEGDYSTEYFFIDILDDTDDFRWNAHNGFSYEEDIEYSRDKETWYSTRDCETILYTERVIHVSYGDRLYFRGINLSVNKTWTGAAQLPRFNGKTKINIGGNIMSLLYKDNFIGKTNGSYSGGSGFGSFFEYRGSNMGPFLASGKTQAIPAAKHLMFICSGTPLR